MALSDPSARWETAPLLDLPVLVVDCQATSSSPATGKPIEVAWCLFRACDALPADGDVASSLVALPDGESPSPRVGQITGIDAALLAGAPAPTAVGKELARAARDAACAIAHVARLEAALLDRLGDPGSVLPGTFLCTHQIAARILPELPSRSLRALAGRFGHAMPMARRAGAHVLATAVVWRELVTRLPAQGVRSLGDLRGWLATRPGRSVAAASFPIGRIERLQLGHRPGVYRLCDGAGRVLYVGKARDLHRRVNGYFQKSLTGAARHAELLTQVRSIDATPTATDVEAALLEVEEIQRLDPPYNVALRRRAGNLLHASPDLAAMALDPDPSCPRGPFPERGAVVLLVTLARGLCGDGDALTTARVALRLASMDPEPPAEGWRQLLDQVLPGHVPTPRTLLRAGRKLARQPLPPDDPLAIAAGALDALTSRAIRELSDGALVSALADSVVHWRPASRRAARRVLVLAGGRVVEARDLAAGTKPPSPPRCPDPPAALTPERYQVLRVLAAEVRRLSSSGREPKLLAAR